MERSEVKESETGIPEENLPGEAVSEETAPEKKLRYRYAELLKNTSPTNPRGGVTQALKGAFFAWGNYDYVKFSEPAKCADSGRSAKKIEQDSVTDEISWLKVQYEESHTCVYDGVEHQPVFLCGREGTKDLISELKKEAAGTAGENASEHRDIFLLTMIQADNSGQSDRKIFRQDLYGVLEQMEKGVEDKISELYPKADTAENVEYELFLNLGESDFILLSKTADIGTAVNILLAVKAAIPVVKTYSLIVFPHLYSNKGRITDADGFIRSMGKWMAKDGNPLELYTQVVTDDTHQKIYGDEDEENAENEGGAKNWNFLFGNYDASVTIRADGSESSGKEIERYILSEPGKLYRYSKTTPVINGELMGTAIVSRITEKERSASSKEKEIRAYRRDVDRLAKSMDAVRLVKWIPEPVKEDLLGAERTLTNLYNYFIRLRETRYAPDVYYCMRFFFNGITEAFEGLMKFCAYPQDDTIKLEAVLRMNHQIKSVISALQKFLGIVALSPRSFSESNGSYMRSANAALKLVVAYHEVLHVMRDVTRNEKPCGLPESICEAVLILPNREDETNVDDCFTFLAPRYHVSVINAGFSSLFNVRRMLFLLAHEAGHTMGERKRKRRKRYFIKAVVRCLAAMELFESDLFFPYTEMAHNIGSNDEFWDGLDNDYAEEGYPLEKTTENAILRFCDRIAVKVIRELEKNRIKVADINEDSREAPLAHAYLKAVSEETAKILGSMMKELASGKTNVFDSDICRVSECIVEENWKRLENRRKSINPYILRMLNAKMIEENRAGKKEWSIRKGIADMETGIFALVAEVGDIMEDIYADIFAVRLLNIGFGEYAEYLLEDRKETDEYYLHSSFLTRFFVVAHEQFGKEEKEVSDVLTDAFGEDFEESFKAALGKIVRFSDFFVKQFEKYAREVKESIVPNGTEKQAGGLRKLRRFYQSPSQHLYDMWESCVERSSGNATESGE